MGFRFGFGLVLGGLLVGCGDGSTFQRTPPFLTASAVELDFGAREIGTTEERAIFILNKGQTTLTLETPEGDPLSGVFAVLLEEEVVQAESDAVVRVRFSPFDPQSYETVFRIANNSTNQKSLAITLKGIGVPRDPCADIDCAAPPAPVCVSQTTSRRYQPLGQCLEGRCEHEYLDEACDRGCDDATGTCRGDPCAGVVCNTPPSGCFFAAGTCLEGACEYEVNNAGSCDDTRACTTGDRCQEGMCVGDPILCETPPAAFCVDSTLRRFWNPQGVCNTGTGACDYVQQEQQCPFGCQDGVCQGDPCAGIICDTPPSTQCFEAMGTCSGGVCQYGTVPGSCDDGDPCTVGDTCSNGSCAGTAQVCSTPPAAVCADGTTLRVYDGAGACSGGACEYGVTNVVCTDNNACTVGDACVSGACRPGAQNPCNDGNPCTADSCDPVAGCRHTPISGTPCITGASECPTGMCSAGTCLPTGGVTCVASYDMCFGLWEEDVAGVCSASGECVVTQAPPQYVCPRCNGLCVVCGIVTLCIPF